MNAAIRYYIKQIEKILPVDGRLGVSNFMSKAGFQRDGGSFKTCYFRDGLEYVIKIFRGDKEDSTGKRELGLIEEFNQFRVPIVFRKEVGDWHILVQEKSEPMEHLSRKRKTKLSKARSFLFRKFCKEASKARGQGLRGYYDDAREGNMGLMRNGRLAFYDGV